VVSTQKLVADLATGPRAGLPAQPPLEDARAQAAYGQHSYVGKILEISQELPAASTSC
jgi:hypothetical protein